MLCQPTDSASNSDGSNSPASSVRSPGAMGSMGGSLLPMEFVSAAETIFIFSGAASDRAMLSCPLLMGGVNGEKEWERDR